jgi:hypothetical protein
VTHGPSRASPHPAGLASGNWSGLDASEGYAWWSPEAGRALLPQGRRWWQGWLASAVSRQPSAIRRQPSAIRHQPSAIRNCKGVQSDRKFPARLNPSSPFLPFYVSPAVPLLLFPFSTLLPRSRRRDALRNHHRSVRRGSRPKSSHTRIAPAVGRTDPGQGAGELEPVTYGHECVAAEHRHG